MKRSGSGVRTERCKMSASFPHQALVIVAILLVLPGIGCTDDTASQENSLLIEFHRSGGIRGTDDRLTIDGDGTATVTRHGTTSTITIDQAVMDRLRRALLEIEFDKLVVDDSPRRGGDAYEYAITYRNRTLRARETALPGALRPIVELLDGILDGA